MGIRFYEDILKLYGNDEKVHFKMVTNLTLYQDDWDDIIRSLFNSFLGVSFDFTRKTVKGYDDFYKVWIKAYEKARSKFRVSLGFVVSSVFVSYPPSFWIKRIKELDPPGHIELNYYVQTSHNRFNDKLKISLSDYIKYVTRFINEWLDNGLDINKIGKIQNFLGVHTPGIEEGMGTLCFFNHCVINPDGAVGSCPILTGNSLYYGNIFTESFTNILSKDKRLELINTYSDVPEVCANCEFSYACGYGCPVLVKNGSFIRGNGCKEFMAFLDSIRKEYLYGNTLR